ncbi:MAG: DUF6448 family protein [Desulfuromonadales bacterium]|nr:DUF6448 family protein [Desulfuromonadales bacterium]
MTKTRLTLWTVLALATGLLLTPHFAWAHCDALDGPVIIEARAALDTENITPLLKWVRTEDEAEIRHAFDQTLAVRKLGDEAQGLADTWFFETLVRVHRAGEGAPFTGVKAAGTIPAPIAKADRALEQGSVDALAKAIASHVEEGIRERFATALESRRHAAESVAAGRAFVADYVTYVHYVEGIVAAVHAGPHHGEPADKQGHAH